MRTFQYLALFAASSVFLLVFVLAFSHFILGLPLASILG